MILVIDTSSALSALATIDGNRLDELTFNVRQTPLPMQFPYVVHDVSKLDKVAVAIGPGSFTGVRVGVSFGLGLAIGLAIPIVPLSTLAIQAARSDEPVLAVSEAGRGRLYYLPPGGEPAVGDSDQLPTDHEVVGWVSHSTERALVAAGLRFRPEAELRWFVKAVAKLLETAREVPYGSLEIEYMQSFSIPAKSEPSA